MLVSWDWLKQYVTLDMPVSEVEQRVMMAGLNHDGTTTVGNDLAINFEVTSNRPDCLGHLGVAREISVLFDLMLKIPAARPRNDEPPVAELAKVSITAPQMCPRYTARVIRGVKIKPSPAWLANRLATIGVAAINNVVDITNYVLFECGQPLHAFDLAKLSGREIIVRAAKTGEQFEAINHKSYTLDSSMCVIADAERPVALAGVMGGARTEVSPSTHELLVESAAFDPVSIRATARKLSLHSDSSHRFERALDPEGVDWASRRACELILELAGGELATGVLDVGSPVSTRGPIVLRFSQLLRILGIKIEPETARRILVALGNREVRFDSREIEVIPPTWRSDLTREIDLVEEVARIHGYDKIPEDVSVPMAPSHRRDEDRVLGKVRHVLTACGCDEALTLSAVEESLSEAFSPWTKMPPLAAGTPVLRRADRLRRSLVPSLLATRRTNETLANSRIELFEVAKVYLPQPTAGSLPSEDLMISITSGRDFLGLKGVVEALVANLNPAARVIAESTSDELFAAGRAAQLKVAVGNEPPELLGYLGEVSAAGLKRFELRGGSTVAELKVAALEKIANLTPQYSPQPAFPAISRDLNLVVDEAIGWADVERTVRESAEPYGEHLAFVDVYRDPERLGPGKKSLLMTLTLRSSEGTLTNDQADGVRDRIVKACGERHQAVLRA